MQVGSWQGNYQLGAIGCSPQHKRCSCEDHHIQTVAGLHYSDAKTTYSKCLKLEQLEEYSYIVCRWSQCVRAANTAKCLFLFSPLPHAVLNYRMAPQAGLTEQCQQKKHQIRLQKCSNNHSRAPREEETFLLDMRTVLILSTLHQRKYYSGPRMKHSKPVASTRELGKRHLRNTGIQHSSFKHT